MCIVCVRGHFGSSPEAARLRNRAGWRMKQAAAGPFTAGPMAFPVSQQARKLIYDMSSPSAQSGARRHPEDRFGAFQAPARKVVPGGIQRVVFKDFQRQLAKWSQEAPRGLFWSISSSSAQSGRRRAEDSPADVTRGTSAKQHSPGVDALGSNLRMRSEKHINR